MNPKLIETLTDAQHEIRALRRQNEILSAKVEVFDSMMCLLHSAPASHQVGASPDVVYALEQRVKELEAEAKARECVEAKLEGFSTVHDSLLK